MAVSAIASRKPLAVGDDVVFAPRNLKRAEPAVVRFVGTLGEESFTSVGLEFPSGCGGRHDGLHIRTGKRGFTCPAGRGLYVSASNPHLARVEAHTADEKQRLSACADHIEERMETETLRRKARLESTYSVIRAQGSGKVVWLQRWVEAQRRYLFFDSAAPGSKGLFQPPSGAYVHPEVHGGPDMKKRATSIGDAYSGPHLRDILDGEVSEDEAQAVLSHFAATSDPTSLHPDYLVPLVWRCSDLFGANPTLVRFPVPANGRAIVLGDTHGHLKDVIHVFRTYGAPSPTNVYLFNGDICDRGDATGERGGQQSIAIWSIILAFKVRYPDSVYFNRGNHEDWYTNDSAGPYGASSFHAEIEQRFHAKDASELKSAFRELFYNVPLAHVIGERVLVLHGGLWRAGWEAGYQKRRSRYVTLTELAALDRKRDFPCGVDKRQDMMMLDCVWNDPHHQAGLLANPRGGNTLCFGGDVTESVLQQEGLAMLIRSHDWPRNHQPHGHEWFQCQYGKGLPKLQGQEALTLSLFTASDYCGETGNMGAAVVFNGNGSTVATALDIQEWYPEEAMRTWMGTSWLEGQVDLRSTLSRENMLARLKSLIVEYKHELFTEFQFEDETHDFHVPIPIWVEVCERILGDFPWASLVGDDPQKTIAFPSATPEPLVCYTEFLARHQIRFRNTMGRHAGFRRAIASWLFETLLVDDQPLRDVVASIDSSGDGRVDVKELQAVLSRVLPGITSEQSWTLLRTTTAHSAKGSVSVHEFLDGIQMRFSSTYAKPAPAEAPWVPSALPIIGKDILRWQRALAAATPRGVGGGGNKSLRKTVTQLLTDFFTYGDQNLNGYLEPSELARALAPLPSCATYSKEEMHHVADYCDLLGNGKINYLEFLHAFNVEENHGSMAGNLHEDLLEGIYRVLFFNYRFLVPPVMKQFFSPGTVSCAPRDFAVALRAVNSTQGLLTEDQISALVDTLSLEKDGLFDFEDYFNSFEIIDTALGVEDEELDEC